MSKSSLYHYFVEVWLTSKSDTMIFPVAEAAWGRLKRAFTDKREGFFIFATRDGRTLAMNLAYVHMARFSREVSVIEEEISEDSSSKLMLCFLEREPESFNVDDPVDLANAFTTLKSTVERQSLSFTDLDGQMVMLFTDELVLIEASTVFVEEGFLRIHKAKKSKG